MPKKALIFIFAFLLFINNANLHVYANENDEYDYEELYKYDGFGKTLYESVYRETSYLMGEHTKNKEYVEKTIDQIGNYASYVYDQLVDFDDDLCRRGTTTVAECFKNHFVNYSAGAITIGEYLYNLFKGFWGEKDMIDIPDPGDVWIIKYDEDSAQVNTALGYGTSLGGHGIHYRYVQRTNSSIVELRGDWAKVYASVSYDGKKNFNVPKTLLQFDNELRTHFKGAYLTYNGQPVFRENPIKLEINNALNDYSRKRGTIAKPKPIPKLACTADNLKLEIRNGSEFYDTNGNKVNVSYDGTAIYNGEECTLTWVVPNMYYDKNGAPIIEDPNGEKKHMETGGDVYVPPTTDACDNNVLCYLTKLLDSIVNFFDNLTDWFIKVFIPEDTTFISESIDNMNNKFSEKIGVLNEVKNALTSSLEETDENVLKDIELRLPILNNKPVPFINFEYVDPFVHYAKKFIAGVVALYTLLHVYRKIVGSGGVMEK